MKANIYQLQPLWALRRPLLALVTKAGITVLSSRWSILPHHAWDCMCAPAMSLTPVGIPPCGDPVSCCRRSPRNADPCVAGPPPSQGTRSGPCSRGRRARAATQRDGRSCGLDLSAHLDTLGSSLWAWRTQQCKFLRQRLMSTTSAPSPRPLSCQVTCGTCRWLLSLPYFSHFSPW